MDLGPIREKIDAIDRQLVSLLNERLALVYEQGITVATNVLRLEYALTQSITLRAETGTASGVGIAYRRSFD